MITTIETAKAIFSDLISKAPGTTMVYPIENERVIDAFILAVARIKDQSFSVMVSHQSGTVSVI